MRAIDRLVALLMMSAAGAAHGAEPVLTIVAPTEVQPGSVVRIDLVGLNPGFGEQVRFGAPRTLPAMLTTVTGTFPVALAATSDAPMAVEPRGFAVCTYSMTVPDAPEGPATLTVTAGDKEIAAAMTIARDGTTAARDRLAPSPALEAFPRTLPGRLAVYQPNYFIYGGGKGEPAAKFQLSLKYRLLTFGQGTPDRAHPSLQLAYTQRSLWDIEGPSSPFFDTSYMPEVFVESLRPASTRERRISFLGWAAGYRHESNGKDGDESRSHDIMYGRAYFVAGSPYGWHFGVGPEVWYYLPTSENTSDIEKYRGYGKASFVIGHAAGPSLLSSVTPEHGFEHLTYQLDLAIPVGVRKLNFATFVVVQYFDGYAESVLDYRHHSQSLRAGLALVR